MEILHSPVCTERKAGPEESRTKSKPLTRMSCQSSDTSWYNGLSKGDAPDDAWRRKEGR